MTDEQPEKDLVAEAATPRPADTGDDGRTRRVLAALFWLLATVSILFAATAVWAHQSLLTANGWGNLVGEVVSDPVVVEDISSALVTRASDSLGVQKTVADFLPGGLAIVAGALTSGVEDRVTGLVVDFASTEGFQSAFVAVNEKAHDAAMAAIRGGDSAALTSEAGVFSINLFPLVEGLLQNLQDNGLIDASRTIPDLTDYQPSSATIAQLEKILGRDLPDDVGTIVLIDSDKLETVQQVVRQFDLITGLFIVLSILFVGLALWLSSSRVRMVMWLAVGAIAALAVGRVLLRFGLEPLTERARDGDAGATVTAIMDAATDSLMYFTFALMVVAAILALVAIWWERHKTGERASMVTPPRTLGQWIRDNMVVVLAAGLAIIGFGILWNVGGPDIALLSAAAVGLLVVAVKVLSAPSDDKAAADPGG